MGQIRAFVAKLMTSRIHAFWVFFGLDYVAFMRSCRESGFVANTRFFGFVLSRLLLRQKGFYSDFVQISVQNIGGWDLCSRDFDDPNCGKARFEWILFPQQVLTLSKSLDRGMTDLGLNSHTPKKSGGEQWGTLPHPTGELLIIDIMVTSSFAHVCGQ